MRPEIALRWFGRIWGLASTLLFAAFLFGGREHLRPTLMELLGLLFFPGGLVAGFLIAWRHERAGGLITVVSLGLFYLWIFCRDGQVPTSPYFLLFAGPGIVHLLSDHIARRNQRPVAVNQNGVSN
jgi:peptidoglycan/LPS O-acetylase OafA/YrhL